MRKPVIAIPMGDPAGIGPEIVLKALGDPITHSFADCVVAGDAGVLRRAMTYPGVPRLEIRPITRVAEARFLPGVLNLVDLHAVDMERFRPGAPSAMGGRAAYQYVEACVRLAMAGEADAVATAPINKVSLHMAGVPYIGHTEIFAALTHTDDPLTMFEVRGMRVFFLTRHVSLRRACDLVTEARIVDYVRRCKAALLQLGVEDGVMAVAGLNPHSGEGGLFGDEEVRAVIPAVKKLQAEGVRVEGPVGADSVFHLALHGRYNSVLSLYHDQGHIATKTLDFERTISVTAGMPILRTSVDHGTAMDIAGTGEASAVGMIEAIRLAAGYAPRFRAYNDRTDGR